MITSVCGGIELIRKDKKGTNHLGLEYIKVIVGCYFFLLACECSGTSEVKDVL